MAPAMFPLFMGCLVFSLPIFCSSLLVQDRLNSLFFYSGSTRCTASLWREDGISLRMVQTRRSVLTKSLFFLSIPLCPTKPIFAEDIGEGQGWAPVTESDIGKSIRYSAVRGARTFNKIDELWAQFSDSLRDEKKCDPVTNRRLFDNGIRKDGTRVGDPVLGALCDPVKMQPLNDEMARFILTSSIDTFVLNNVMVQNSVIQQTMKNVLELVRPSFDRTKADVILNMEDTKKRQEFNLALYVQMRAFSELTAKSTATDQKRVIKLFELSWGDKLMKKLAPRADRNDFKSPLPPLQATESLYQYDVNQLLDALGIISVGLNNLQNSGFIGLWEIIIPPDDYGDVVTIAIDNDTTLPVQILLQEQRKLFKGSLVTALVAAAMEKYQISFNLDSFFIDPSTTKQDKYNPSQLLLSLSNLTGPLL